MLSTRNLAGVALTLAIVAVSSSTAAQGASGSASARPVPSASAVKQVALTQNANIEVMVLYASNEEPHVVDPKIDEGHPRERAPSAKLGKGPFAGYKTYKLKDRKLHALKKNETGDLLLPNGRTLKVTLNDVVVEKNEKRYKISASISQPKGPAYLPLLEVNAAQGTTFFVAGQTHEKGSLVLAFTVKS
jgi:hypothetical protein